MLVIPYQDLELDTLQALLEEIATRDGTDYGAIELPLEKKVEQIKKQLKTGIAVICFDELTESCSIVAKEDVKESIENDSC